MASGLQTHLDRITDGLKHLDEPAATATAADAPPALAKGRGGAMPATSALSHFSDELAEIRKTAGQPLRVRMDQCDEGPYHTTPIEEERVAGLKANMKENGQSSPALLRKKADGRYEIVAGRHRKAALLELGQDEWEAVLKDISDDQAERLTFYDNLLAPSLTDFARYMGFARRKASTGFTDKQLAEESGLSRTAVNRLMAFGNLPARAMTALEKMPPSIAGQVSGTVVVELVKLLPKARERVDEAMEKVAAGDLKASEMPRWVLNVQPAKPASARPEPHHIRAGKATFAKVSRKEGRVLVDFADPEQAGALERSIVALIEEHVRTLHPGKAKARSG